MKDRLEFDDGQYQENQQQAPLGTIEQKLSPIPLYKKPQQPKRRWPKRIFLLLLIILAFGSIGKILLKTEAPNDPSQYDPITLEEKKPAGFLQRIRHFVLSRDVVLEGHRDDRINILLLGMGGPGHDGPYLTDTIILASIKPSANGIALVSIPRDLGVDIPGYGVRKINHANAFGEIDSSGHGGEFAKRVMEETFDIPIHYYIRIDFKAFEEIIDHVGGITIDVERSFTDAEYPAPNNEFQTVSFTKGVQTMNGSRALVYARSRHGNNSEGSDFARAKRQQKMLLALKEKALSFETLINPVRINNIIRTLDEHLTTDMAFNEIVAMMKLGKMFTAQSIKSLVLDTSEGGYLTNIYSPDGAFILGPKEGSMDRIRNDIQNIFDLEIVPSTPDTTPEQDSPGLSPARIEILNGTWRAGLAARIKKLLTEQNFTVSSVGNTQERPQMVSGIYVLNDVQIPDVTASLKEALHIPIKQTPPPTEKAASSTDVLIILGEDFEEQQ